MEKLNMDERMKSDFDQNDSVESLPAADISVPHDQRDVFTTQRSLPVRVPKKDADDFIVEVSASDLKRIRSKIIPYLEQRFSRAELLIGIGGISVGATVSSICSQLSLQSFWGIVFYIFAPMVAVGTIVRYLSHSKSQTKTTNNLAREILAEIPNPDDAIDKAVDK